MFKDMFSFLSADYDVPTTDFEKKYFAEIENFAFYDALDEKCLQNNGKGIKQLMAGVGIAMIALLLIPELKTLF